MHFSPSQIALLHVPHYNGLSFLSFINITYFNKFNIICMCKQYHDLDGALQNSIGYEKQAQDLPNTKARLIYYKGR